MKKSLPPLERAGADGYYVDLVDNGTQALEMALGLSNMTWILLDLNLCIDGFDLLRTRAEHSETKVLIFQRSSVSDRIVD